MRILQVINVRWHNATAWYALTQARLLRDAGHEVLLVTQPGTEPERLALEMGLPCRGIDLNTSNPARLLPAAASAVKLLGAFRPHVVNCHRGEGFFLWCLFRPIYGYGLVRTRGDQRPPRGDLLNRLMHSRSCDAVVVTNSAMARHFMRAMRLRQSQLWLIPGGVDRDAFCFDPSGRKRVRAEFGFAPDDLVVGLVGRFDKVKGQRELIEAASLARREPDARRLRLFLIGFDSAVHSDEVKGWIRHFGMEDSTRISGKRNDMAACLSAVDVGFVASLWSETIARAALELMSVGRPVISTSVGVMPDLVAPHALMDPGDVQAMARMLLEAMRNQDFLASLAAEQRKTISQLGLNEFLRQTLSLFEMVRERR